MLDTKNLTGSKLEDTAQETFTKMGLVCVHRLNQAKLKELHPSGSYGIGEHLEFDYLIPYQKYCIIGEITSRANDRDLQRKYHKFRDQINFMKNLDLNERVWQLLGVPDEYLLYFREVKYLKGSFIIIDLQKFDVELSDIPDISCFFKSDWDLLIDYSKCIGMYAKYHILNLFEIRGDENYRPLHIKMDVHGLMRTPNKKIAGGGIGMADIYTFEVSPYDLFPMARVYRRDMLPDLSSASADKYQRPLIMNKLGKIRKNLLTSQDFIFPNSILVVLSNDCSYSNTDRSLLIPDYYGAISVIDGQHRLFSYADESVSSRLTENCRIMVTAIQFKDVDNLSVQKFSARIFIEINTNQTQVRTSHIDAIAYAVLGETSSRALAAQIILNVNSRRGKLFGLFDTNQSSLGIIQTTTVLIELKAITNLKHIRRLTHQKGGRANEIQGYENLFGITLNTLDSAETLITQGTICFEQFFNRVANVFEHDWPERGKLRYSSLFHSKVFAGFVKLLSYFISKGYNWHEVQSNLEKIRDNLMELRGIKEYNTPLLDETDPRIPSYRPSTLDNYNFLIANIEGSTSIEKIITKR